MAALVSVVLPTFRRAGLIGRAVRSVLAQTFTDWELIIVDDNGVGTEAQLETLRTLRPYLKDERIRYLNQSVPSGGSAARNVGIRSSEATLLAFLDDDDEWLPRKLELQVDRFARSRYECLGVVYSRYYRVYEAGTTRECGSRLKGKVFDDLLIRNSIGTTSTVMCTREALDAVGLFDPTLPASQDHDLYIRLAAHYAFDFVEEPLVKSHRHSLGNISSNVEAKKAAYERLYLRYVDRLQSCREIHVQHLKYVVWALLGMGEGTEARRWLRRGLKLNPYDPELIIFTASCYLSSSLRNRIWALLKSNFAAGVKYRNS